MSGDAPSRHHGDQYGPERVNEEDHAETSGIGAAATATVTDDAARMRVLVVGAGVTSPVLGLLRFAPTGLLAMIAGTLLDTDYADLVVARHANNARDEMKRLAEQISVMANDSGVDTPSADALAAYI